MRSAWALGFILAFFVTTAARAEDRFISGVPKDWRLQNYVGNGVVIWYTGSICANGLVQTGKLTGADKSRLYATVMAAKVSNKKMYLYYDTNGCEITSFGMDAP